MRTLGFLLVGATALAGCSAVPPPVRTAQAEAELQTALAGRVAGPPIACLPHHRADHMITIDDNTILFNHGATVYRNDLAGGGCARLGSGFYSLVTRTSGGTGLCRGDIAEVADASTGAIVGSCVLGDFVPYVRP